MAELYLFTLVAIVETNASPSDHARSYLLKECLATLGLLASSTDHRLALSATPLPLYLLSISLSGGVSHLKLLKTSLSTLCNLCPPGSPTLTTLSTTPAFYQLLYTLLDLDSLPLPILDCLLLLVLATTSCLASQRNYLSGGKLLGKCLQLAAGQGSVVAVKVLRGVLGTTEAVALERLGGVGGLLGVIARASREVGSSQGRELFVETVLLIA